MENLEPTIEKSSNQETNLQLDYCEKAREPLYHLNFIPTPPDYVLVESSLPFGRSWRNVYIPTIPVGSESKEAQSVSKKVLDFYISELPSYGWLPLSPIPEDYNIYINYQFEPESGFDRMAFLQIITLSATPAGGSWLRIQVDNRGQDATFSDWEQYLTPACP